MFNAKFVLVIFLGVFAGVAGYFATDFIKESGFLGGMEEIIGGALSDTVGTGSALLTTGGGRKLVAVVDLNSETPSVRRPADEVAGKAAKSNQAIIAKNNPISAKAKAVLPVSAPSAATASEPIPAAAQPGSPQASNYYNVNVSLQGNGIGTVSSDVPGIYCGSDCEENFPEGTQIELEALPGGESVFSGWSGACSGTARCNLTVKSAISLVAVFGPRLAAQPASDGTNVYQNTENVLINEILYDAEGSDAGKEFIELKNPTGGNIDLSGWSLRRDGNSLASIGSKEEDKTVIPAGGFFLVGLNGYSGSPAADVIRSASLPNIAATITLENADGTAVNAVSYNESVEAGKSWERVSPNSGDFRAQSSPNPANSGS